MLKLLLAVVFLALAWGVWGPPIPGGSSSRRQVAQSDINNFAAAIRRFRADCGYYPTNLEITARAVNYQEMSDGSNVLTKRPATIPESVWRGPYLDERSSWNDPWGRPYVYGCPGKHNPDSFDIYSLGPNGNGGAEAIGNWAEPH